MTDATFEPPGPGEWRTLADHFPASLPIAVAEALEDGFDAGSKDYFPRYGLPASHLTMRCVNGYPYVRAVPLVESRGRSLPPRSVLWALSRIHPGFRKARRAARRALSERPWIAESRQWYEEQSPRLRAQLRVLQDEPIAAMSDDELATHIEQCALLASDGMRRHFTLHGADLAPTGLLVARGKEWGLTPADILTSLQGWAPASRGEDPLLARLHELVAATGATPNSLDAVRALGPDISAALDAYLAEYGWRLVTSYEFTGRALIELPALLLQRILTPAGDAEPLRAAAETISARLRERVPIEDRAEFDQRLGDARATSDLRDDNGQLTAAWPSGLLRRCYLEAGRRLAARSGLDDRDDVFELRAEETAALLRGTDGPTPRETAERANTRRALSALQPPPTLGPPEPPPPLDLLPRELALMGAALVGSLELMSTPPSEGASLRGVGVGTATYRGTAVVAHAPEEAIERILPGDVLIATFTTPAYNAVLPIVGALVVQEGGLLSHAAVMARELALPAVIGVAGVMTRVHDGDEIEVDPELGEVRVLKTASPPGA